jgi:DNA replication and repair protein RecF
MHIESIALTRFRNYESGEIAFCPGLNLLTGPNGHGKTNLLEAVHYACLAHSQRTRKDKELIAWNADAFVLRLRGRAEDREHVQSVEYTATGAKRVKVDGSESKRLSDLIGRFSVVSFSPEDLDLIRSGPQLRRRFLDVLLCQFSLDYLDTLRRYNQALKQRNSLLRQEGPAPDVLAAYDAALIESGARITIMRREDFGRKLASLRAAEREAGLTLAGPHREDLGLFLGGRAVRDYGSQGQKRSTALSIKLASARLLEAKNGRPPILLLDDVFAELDEARRKRIGDMIRGKGQVFIANPRAADLPFEAEKTIHLLRGREV